MTETSAARPLELRRLGSLTVVVLAVVFGLVVANFALSALLGASSPLLRRQVVYSPSEFDRIAEQVAAAERDLANDARARGSVAGGVPLAIVVGLSTAREDIDAPTIQRAVCGGSRLLNLGSSGGSFRELSYYLKTLDGTQLRPIAVLLAVHPVWMTSRMALPDSPVDMREVLRRVRRPGDVVGVSRLAARSVWVRANRNTIHTVLTNELLRFRWAFTAPFGLALSALVPMSSEDPWAPRFAYRESRATPEFLEAQMRSWKAWGWFDSNGYTALGPEGDALADIARLSSRLASQSLVVLMPESSTLRAKVPPAAEESLRSALTEKGFSFPILDFRGSVPDSLFYDYAHLNAAGRMRFSRGLAASLRRLIPCEKRSATL